MQLGSRAKSATAAAAATDHPLPDEEVDAIARELASARAAAALAPPADARAEAAADLAALAAGATGPVAHALRSLASYSRGDWPADSELARLRSVGRELAELASGADDLTSDAAARVAEAEAARERLARDMSAFVAAAVSAEAEGDRTPSGALQRRVDALETLVFNLRSRLDRAQPGAAAGAGAGDAAAAAASPQLVNELRARVTKLEGDNAGLRSRLEGIESQVAHLERILEAAAGFAAEERAGGGR